MLVPIFHQEGSTKTTRLRARLNAHLSARLSACLSACLSANNQLDNERKIAIGPSLNKVRKGNNERAFKETTRQEN